MQNMHVLGNWQKAPILFPKWKVYYILSLVPILLPNHHQLFYSNYICNKPFFFSNWKSHKTSLCSLPLGHVRQKNQVCHLSRGKIITDYLSKKLHILSKSTNLVSFKINVYLNFICLGERQINHIFRFHHEDWWFAWCVAIAFFRSALGLWLWFCSYKIFWCFFSCCVLIFLSLCILYLRRRHARNWRRIMWIICKVPIFGAKHLDVTI